MKEEEAQEVVRSIRDIIGGRFYSCPMNIVDIEVYRELLSLTNLVVELKRTKLIRGTA